MKEATGELNVTVITIIVIAAVAALFYTVIWPTIARNIEKNTCESGTVSQTMSHGTCTCSGTGNTTVGGNISSSTCTYTTGTPQ